ncbi:MAG: SOS response-associated peptidase [Alphaproteobacteria bacterium]
MCGRFGLMHSWEEIHAAYGLVSATFELQPRYNIAPSQAIVAIIRAASRDDAGGNIDELARVPALFGWGLVPSWAKDPAMGARMINARAETIAKKPSFRAPFRRRRCLIPASGFYEWQSTGTGPKQPVWISRPDGGLISFAGLWDAWLGPDGSELETATIITTEANETLRPFHHRMPVILNPDSFDTWLGNGTDDRFDREAAGALLHPAPEDIVRVVPVGRAVNDIRNDGPELLTPHVLADEPPDQGELF